MTSEANGQSDVFRRDLLAATTVRVSVDRDGGDSDGSVGSFAPTTNHDGDMVAFLSDAHDLVEGDGMGFGDRQVFVRDMTTGVTVRPGVDINGGDPEVESFIGPGLSGNGRYVGYFSGASDLVEDDTNGKDDLFVTDLTDGSTSLVSRAWNGTQANGDSGVLPVPSLTADGRYVTFTSQATNLDSKPHAEYDVYVRAAIVPTVDAVAPSSIARGHTVTFTITGTGFTPETRVHAYSESGHADDLTVQGVEVVSETAIRAAVSVAADAPTGELALWVEVPGPGPGVVPSSAAICTSSCPSIT